MIPEWTVNNPAVNFYTKCAVNAGGLTCKDSVYIRIVCGGIALGTFSPIYSL